MAILDTELEQDLRSHFYAVYNPIQKGYLFHQQIFIGCELYSW